MFTPQWTASRATTPSPVRAHQAPKWRRKTRVSSVRSSRATPGGASTSRPSAVAPCPSSTTVAGNPASRRAPRRGAWTRRRRATARARPRAPRTGTRAARARGRPCTPRHRGRTSRACETAKTMDFFHRILRGFRPAGSRLLYSVPKTSSTRGPRWLTVHHTRGGTLFEGRGTGCHSTLPGVPRPCWPRELSSQTPSTTASGPSSTRLGR